MSLVLNVPPELETELAAEAIQIGLPLPEYALRLLAGGRSSPPSPRIGAELVACWQGEGLIGTRPEITDGSARSRRIRDQLQIS